MLYVADERARRRIVEVVNVDAIDAEISVTTVNYAQHDWANEIGYETGGLIPRSDFGLIDGGLSVTELASITRRWCVRPECSVGRRQRNAYRHDD